MHSIRKKAWVTLMTNVTYLPGTLVLDYSLKAVRSKYPLVVMATSTVSNETRDVLERRGIELRDIDAFIVEGQNIASKRFSDTWTKLKVFELQEYERAVLLDSDMLVRKNMDELMEAHLEDGWIGAVHACACNPRKISTYPADWIPAHCAYTCAQQPARPTDNNPRPYGLLNSGMVVLKPNVQTAQAIKEFLAESPLVPTFLFPDQDLLAEVFKGKWKPLPWYYNALKTLRNIHQNLWKDEEVRCLHYILSDKPWSTRPGPVQARETGEYEVMNRWWWEAFQGLRNEMNARDAPEAAQNDWKLVEANVASV